nr:MAG TPA: hypothetical protein [Caudoviricetes sp.]
MNANVLMRTEQGVVLRSAAQPDFAKFGNRGTGFEHSGKNLLYGFLLMCLRLKFAFCLPCDIIIHAHKQNVNHKF